jgi:hypothetical protein
MAMPAEWALSSPELLFKTPTILLVRLGLVIPFWLRSGVIGKMSPDMGIPIMRNGHYR